MRTVFDKIKLCTCNTTYVERLKHYWILKMPEENGIIMMGMTIPPANIGEEVEKYNVETLTKQLNSGNCFDKDVNLMLEENYILELHFTCFPKLYEKNYLAYAFVHKKGNGKKPNMIILVIIQEKFKEGK